MNLTLAHHNPQHDCRRNAIRTDRRTTARPLDLSHLLMSVLDEIDYGMIMVDECARMRHANQAALSECASGRSVSICAGRVTMVNATDQSLLQDALWAARQGRRSLLQTHGAQDAPTIAVVPLDEAGGTSTLLIFGKQQLCEPLSMEFFSRSHHLTAAEGAVLRSLCDGKIPDQIATDNGVACSTVRTQVISIRSKTGTRSIRDLIERITSLPPIVSRLRLRKGLAFSEPDRAAA